MESRKDETLEEEEEEYPGDVESDDEEDELADAEAEPEGDETSLDAMLAKPEVEAPGEDEEEEDSILSLGSAEERIDALSVRVEPKKDTEFVCKNCYLVKPIRSQLADKARMFCRDCA